MMNFVYNLPFISIVLCLFGAVTCSVLKAKAARILTVILEILLVFFSASVLVYTLDFGNFTYDMGHFDSPWSNQLRAGVTEGIAALMFSLVLLLSHIGGIRYIKTDIALKKQNLYCTLLNLVGAALMALSYTNDLFTGYVFLEIMTLASCGLLVVRRAGRTVLAATRYMVLNLLGSGLFLLGLSLFYGITGHLLMEYVGESVKTLDATGEYALPLTVTIGLVSAGLGIKAGLFPFHTWMPDTYGCATPTSSSLLSGIISKGYIFLLMKIMYRVVGLETDALGAAQGILFVLGICGMIIGSVSAMNSQHMNRMIAYSSAAQIGYIFVGIGLGGELGFVAAILQMMAHSFTKPLLFLSGARLSEVSGDSEVFRDLQGSAHHNKLAGALFAVGALSMTGIPMLAGFTAKLYFAIAATEQRGVVAVTVLAALAVSTLLNALYFIRTVIRIYTPSNRSAVYRKTDPDDDGNDNGETVEKLHPKRDIGLIISSVGFLFVIILLGINSQPIVDSIVLGLSTFA